MRSAMTLIPLSLALSLAACGGGGASQADNAAGALENAAEQSTPEAANVLEGAADQIRASNGADANAAAQAAMQAAGNAQVSGMGAGGGNGATPAPPSQGAKPHAPGDPVPPPKVSTSPTGQ